MEAISSLPQLLARRKITRAASELIRQQLKEYMAILTPSFRPRAMFGEFVQGGAREGLKSEKALQELQEAFVLAAGAKPFSLEQKQINPPLTFDSAALEYTELEYRRELGGRSILITSPLRWIVFFANYPPKRLRELLAEKNRNNAELRQYLLHYVGLHIIVTRQPGLAQMLEALHYRLVTRKLPEFGEMPVTMVESEVETVIPPDSLILESTELSGRDVFEEVVDLESITKLRDALKDKLADLASAAQA